jgi:hypothetical protein
MENLEDLLLEALKEEPVEMSDADWEELRRRVRRLPADEEPDGLQ